MIKELNPKEAFEKFKEGALLVDVREQYEVEQFACDVPESIVIPLSQLEKRYNELPHDRKMIMVCAGGGRSLYAAKYLANKGYDNIENLYGGVFAWNAQGLPIKKSSQADEKSVSSCKLWF